MSTNKIILGTAAFVVTAASTLAFKPANRFGKPSLWGTNKFVSPPVTCHASTCWSKTTGKGGVCHTQLGGDTLTTLYNTSGCTTKFPRAFTRTPQP